MKKFIIDCSSIPTELFGKDIKEVSEKALELIEIYEDDGK